MISISRQLQLFTSRLGIRSLGLARNYYSLYTFFLSLNPKSSNEIQEENFKEILLRMCVDHKAAFTSEVSFSTSKYDARWMYFTFKYSLMDIAGSIHLHNSMQTFSIRIVCQLRAVKGILVLNTTQRKKCEKKISKKKWLKKT